MTCAGAGYRIHLKCTLMNKLQTSPTRPNKNPFTRKCCGCDLCLSNSAAPFTRHPAAADQFLDLAQKLQTIISSMLSNLYFWLLLFVCSPAPITNTRREVLTPVLTVPSCAADAALHIYKWNRLIVTPHRAIPLLIGNHFRKPGSMKI